MYPEDTIYDAETMEEIEESDMTCNQGEDELVDPESRHKQGAIPIIQVMELTLFSPYHCDVDEGCAQKRKSIIPQ